VLYWHVPFHMVFGEVEYDQVDLVPVRTCISIDGWIMRIDEMISTIDLPETTSSPWLDFSISPMKMTYQCFALLAEADYVLVKHPNRRRVPALPLGAELGEVRVHREPRLGLTVSEAAICFFAVVPLDGCQQQEHVEEGVQDSVLESGCEPHPCPWS
jgi:hypothetical protein